MKQKDIAVIIVVAFISAVISFLVSDKVFVTPANRQQKVEVVDKIVPDFVVPDTRYFNNKSIDPTQNTQLNDTTNPAPFNNPAGR